MQATRNTVHTVVPQYAFGSAVPSSAAPAFISLKNAHSVTVLIHCTNTTDVTGSAVTLQQAQAVAGTNAKALAFEEAWVANPANSNNYAKVAVASNTFTTATNASVAIAYQIPVDPATLDSANGFDCLRVALANAVNTTVTAYYVVQPKYGGNEANRPSLIVD